ncbi:hypothetical protein ACFQX7_08465 [Luedemannella flava]
MYQYLDNQWFSTALTNGLAGVAAMLALHAVAAWMAYKALRRAATQADRELCAALLSIQFVALFAAFTFDSLSFTTYSSMLAILIGFCGTVWRLTHPVGQCVRLVCCSRVSSAAVGGTVPIGGLSNAGATPTPRQSTCDHRDSPAVRRGRVRLEPKKPGSTPNDGRAQPGGSGAVLVPVDGGPDYYAKFSPGLPTDPGFFPIAVWYEASPAPTTCGSTRRRASTPMSN